MLHNLPMVTCGGGACRGSAQVGAGRALERGYTQGVPGPPKGGGHNPVEGGRSP